MSGRNTVPNPDITCNAIARLALPSLLASLAGLVTMAFHPTGHASTSDFAQVAAINRTVHSLAIAGTIATFFGLLRLSRQIANGKALSDAALVSYGFGAVAVMFAAIASGFIATDLDGYRARSGGNARAAYEPAFDSRMGPQPGLHEGVRGDGFNRNRAVVVAMLRDPAFGRGIGDYRGYWSVAPLRSPRSADSGWTSMVSGRLRWVTGSG